VLKKKNGTLRLEKEVGKIGSIKPEDFGDESSLAIAHSRWATHGGVTKLNAHPHFSDDDRIAVVHNGIIENFLELREELKKKGHTFKSETDTEVIPHLIEEYLKTGLSLTEAVRTACKRFHGRYAILVMDKESEALVAARTGSPLIVGVGKKEWFIALCPVGIVWILDHLTKLWASRLMDIYFFGPMGFILHNNHSAILGTFSDLPPVLRIVSLSTGGAFLLFLFGIIQFLLPSKSLTLRAGLSFLLGGILGNVTDRILWGYVVDFIVFGSPDGMTPAFNIADALQWVGYAMIMYSLIKDGKHLFPDENLRKNHWINPRFQLKYCFTLMAFGAGLAVIAGVFSYTYMKVALKEVTGSNPLVLAQFLKPYVLTFIVITAAFSAVLFVVGLILSHRAAGPLYAFERFMNDYLSGKNPKLKLRAGDEFKQLELLAERLNAELKRHG
jgi:signal peptidase II